MFLYLPGRKRQGALLFFNKFSDFADTTVSPIMDGKKLAFDDVLDKEIIVLRCRLKPSKFKDAKNPGS
ncbi:MAG: hypothetical protein LBG43_06180 [Treponema sp.]|nr:hypothetical protein [Treponema sp.]